MHDLISSVPDLERKVVLVGRYEAWVTLEVTVLTLNWYFGVYVLEICLRELGEYASAPRHRSALSVPTDWGQGVVSLAGVTLSVYSCLIQGLPLDITALQLQCNHGLI